MLRLLKNLILLVVLVAVLGGVAYLFRAPLCRQVGHWWVVNDTIQKGDAVVVLGGGTEWRPFAAADVYREGLAPLVLLPNTGASPAEQIGAKLPDITIEQSILNKLGVPSDHIATYAERVQSCYEEAVALRDWAMAHQVKTVIIPTDTFNSRRVKWIFEKQLKDSGITVLVRAVNPPSYNLENWWQQEDGVVSFIMEIIKFTYYRCNY